MNYEKLYTLSEFFALILEGDILVRGELYFQSPPPWIQDSNCAILREVYLNLDDEKRDDRPIFAKEHNLTNYFDIQDVLSIFNNVRLQTSVINIEILIRALNHYQVYDAFLNLKP